MKMWQKTNKSKKRLILLLAVTILLGGIGLTAFFSAPKTAHAAAAFGGTQLSLSTQTALEQKMKSKTFTHDGTAYHINQYLSLLHGNSGSTRVAVSYNSLNGKVTGTFQQTDPITSLIPVAVFDELKSATDVYWCMGEQWGIIIDPISDSYGIKHLVVQLIEITTNNNVVSEEHNYSLEIKPLFEVDFVWISDSSGTVNLVAPNSTYSFGPVFQSLAYARTGSAGLYALPTWYTYTLPYFDGQNTIYHTYMDFQFQQVKRNYINNFTFAGILANEQDANFLHNDYVARDDYGAYFIGNDLYFNAYDTNSLNIAIKRDPSALTWDAIKLFAGVLSNFDPTGVLGLALSTLDIIEFTDNLTPSSSNLPPEHYFNLNSVFPKYEWVQHNDQIIHYGHLMKDTTTLPSNKNAALTLFGTDPTYAKAVFYITQMQKPIAVNPVVYENRFWTSRLNIGFSFDLRRYNSSDNFSQTVTWEKTEILRGEVENSNEVSLAENISLYNYYQNTSMFTFIAPQPGYYKVDFVNPAHQSWYNYDSSEVYLNAGQAYNFSLEYLYNDVSVSTFMIEKTDFRFKLLSSGTAYSVSALSDFAEIVIPSQYKGLPVTQIAANGFKDRNNLESLVIPDSVTNIGYSAFYNCSKLKDVTLSNKLVSIGNLAFYNCSTLLNMIIPNSVTTIESAAFYNCTALKSVTLSNNLTNLSSGVFENCISLVTLTIPANITTIEEGALKGCAGLTKLAVPFVGNDRNGTNSNHFGYFFWSAKFCKSRLAYTKNT